MRTLKYCVTNLHGKQNDSGNKFILHNLNSQWMDAHMIYVVQSLSHVQLLRTPWTVAHQVSLSLSFPSLSLSFPSLSYLLKFAQTHVQWVSDAIQPLYPLSPPSPPVFNISQHQGLFQWVSSLHQVAKYIGASASASVLPVNVQGWFPLVFDR